jgi:hypothetical protein
MTIGLEFTFDLYFPVEKTGNVLLDIVELADGAAEHRTHLVLPDASMVTVPFGSSYQDGTITPLAPGDKIRLDLFLNFPQHDAEYIRLWLFMGERHVKFTFFAPSAHACSLFVESSWLQDQLSRLLARHEGILGLLDVDADVSYLLPDLKRGLVCPNILDYYGPDLNVLDVDRWVADLGKLEKIPVPPPAVLVDGQKRNDPEQSLLKALESVLGTWREPVPQRYHRTFEEKPFDTCDFCGKPLLAPGIDYLVTKFFRQDELVQEMVVCLDCGKEMQKTYSAESAQAIQRFFSRLSLVRRLQIVANNEFNRLGAMTARCCLCDAPKEKVTHYVEYAHCVGTEVVYHVYPAMLCEDCILQANELLSKETRERWRRFYDEHFGFPPSGGLHRTPVKDVLPLWAA